MSQYLKGVTRMAKHLLLFPWHKIIHAREKKDVRQEHSWFLPSLVNKLLKWCLIGLCSVLYQTTCWLKVLKTVTATAEKEGSFSPMKSFVASSEIKRILSKASRLQTRGIRRQRMLLFIQASFYKLIFSWCSIDPLVLMIVPKTYITNVNCLPYNWDGRTAF